MQNHRKSTKFRTLGSFLAAGFLLSSCELFAVPDPGPTLYRFDMVARQTSALMAFEEVLSIVQGSERLGPEPQAIVLYPARATDMTFSHPATTAIDDLRGRLTESVSCGTVTCTTEWTFTLPPGSSERTRTTVLSYRIDTGEVLAYELSAEYIDQSRRVVKLDKPTQLAGRAELEVTGYGHTVDEIYELGAPLNIFDVVDLRRYRWAQYDADGIQSAGESDLASRAETAETEFVPVAPSTGTPWSFPVRARISFARASTEESIRTQVLHYPGNLTAWTQISYDARGLQGEGRRVVGDTVTIGGTGVRQWLRTFLYPGNQAYRIMEDAISISPDVQMERKIATIRTARFREMWSVDTSGLRTIYYGREYVGTGLSTKIDFVAEKTLRPFAIIYGGFWNEPDGSLGQFQIIRYPTQLLRITYVWDNLGSETQPDEFGEVWMYPDGSGSGKAAILFGQNFEGSGGSIAGGQTQYTFGVSLAPEGAGMLKNQQ